MVNPFKIFWQKDTREDDLRRELAFQAQQAPDAPDPQAYGDPYGEVKRGEQDRSLLSDEYVVKKLNDEPALEPLIFALAPVNRTSNINETEAKISYLNFKILAIETETCMSPEDYEDRMLEKMQGAEMYHDKVISDSKNGWKGHLYKEARKVITTVLGKQK